MKALVMYWSATGNTEKVARTIEETVKDADIEADLVKIPDGGERDIMSYDLVFLGSPSYQFAPPEPVSKAIKAYMKRYNESGVIKPGSPTVPGKNAAVFVTYSGPHTGIDEAVPVGKNLGQFLAHLGFAVREEFYTVGEFHNNPVMSTQGRLGDITGRPNAEDLGEVRAGVKKLLSSL